MEGYVDSVTSDHVEGWVWDPSDPERSIAVRVYDNGLAIGETIANLLRDDLRQAGIGDGRHAFRWSIPKGLLSEDFVHRIEIKCLPGDWCLPGSGEPIDPVRDETPTPSPLIGNLEICERHLISGWAMNGTRPDVPVSLEIFDGETSVGRVLSNRYRKDLAEAGIGDGRHAFQIRIPEGLSPLTRHVIRVVREGETTEISGSPFVIEPSDSFDSALEEAVSRAIDALALEHDQTRILSFLAAQTQRLLKRHAEIDAHSAARDAYREFRRTGSATEGHVDPNLRALVIDEEVPDVRRDAGSQAILSHMKALQGLGYSVSLVAAYEQSQGTLAELLQSIGISVFRPPFYPSVEDVLKWQRDCFDLIYLHRVSNAEKYMALARHYNRRARVIYSVADLHHVRIERQAKVEERPELLPVSRRLRLAEYTSAVYANAVITHSNDEADQLRTAVPSARVHVVPWEVPLLTIETAIEQRAGVAFLAGFRHRPNVDAAWFLIKKIMPLVWQRDPSIKCLLAGSHIPNFIEDLAGPQVEILGAVEHLNEVFERVRLTIAPLRYGAGVKGKVLNSFAAGIPCVMAPVGAEGLSLGAKLQSLVGSNAEELAGLIVKLHHDVTALKRLSGQCQEFIRAQFSEEVTAAALKAAINGC